VLVDSLTKFIMDGDHSGMQNAQIYASVLDEGSPFIAPPEDEEESVLTSENDLGSIFRARMEDTGPMIDMIANELSSGKPLAIVNNNVVATISCTPSQKDRSTLMRASRVLAGMR